MSLLNAHNSMPPLYQRGQGTVEAILALPVFLVLICLTFQLFFLGMAQIQLQYAAFYAARVGAVTAVDKNAMKKTVGRILSKLPLVTSFSSETIDLEILGPEDTYEKENQSNTLALDKTLKIRISWDYPLIIPFADLLASKKTAPFALMKRPSIRLHASWAMVNFESTVEQKKNAKKTNL